MSGNENSDPRLNFLIQLFGYIYLGFFASAVVWWIRKYGFDLAYDQNAHNILISSLVYFAVCIFTLATAAYGIGQSDAVYRNIGDLYHETVYKKFTDPPLVEAIITSLVSATASFFIGREVIGFLGYEYTGGFTKWLLFISLFFFNIACIITYGIVRFSMFLNENSQEAKWERVRAGQMRSGESAVAPVIENLPPEPVIDNDEDHPLTADPATVFEKPNRE